AVQAGEPEQPQLRVLAALHEQAGGDDRGRGRAEVDVALVQLRLVGRRPVLKQPRSVRAEYEDAVAPVPAAVPLAVPRRDEQAAAPGGDDDTRARPDRGAALGARARPDQRVPVAAERVPDVDEAAGAR